MDRFQVIRRIEENLGNHKKIDDFLKNRRLIVAVSAGLDSTVLFDILNHLSIKGLVQDLSLLHVNYGLRGADSQADEEFVQNLAKAQNLPIYIKRVLPTTQLESGLGIQEWAREIRHRWFQEFVAQGYLVCLAHHLDDQVETLLFRMIRGVSARHWLGMQALSQGLWRPLLKLRRQELEAYQKLYNLTYRVDASNAKITYSRNFLRLQIMRPLEQRFPGAAEKVLNLAQEVDELAEWAEDQIKVILVSSGETGILASADIIKYPRVIQGILLSHFLKDRIGEHCMLSRLQIAEILNKFHEIKDSMKSCEFSLPGHEQVYVSRDGIELIDKKNRSDKFERASQWARSRWPVQIQAYLAAAQTMQVEQPFGLVTIENIGDQPLDLCLFQALGTDGQRWRGRLKGLCLKYAVPQEERYRWLILRLAQDHYAANGEMIFDFFSGEPISQEKLGLRIRY